MADKLNPSPRYDKAFYKGLENMNGTEDKEGLLLTAEELTNILAVEGLGKPLQTITAKDVWRLLEAQLSKAQSCYEAKIEEAKKQERERILNKILIYLEERRGRFFVPSMIKWIELLKSPDKGGS